MNQPNKSQLFKVLNQKPFFFSRLPPATLNANQRGGSELEYGTGQYIDAL